MKSFAVRLRSPRYWRLIFVLLLAALGIVLAMTCLPTGLVGGGRFMTGPVPQGVAPKMDASSPPVFKGEQAQHGRNAVQSWAEMALPDWQEHGKVSAPRICLAKLLTNRDVKEVNDYLLAVKPWSTSGSYWGVSWFTGNKGDYDFSEVTLIEILYLFGEKPEVLFPETRQHILDVLLIENGNKPRMAAPNTLGVFSDTENHHLMTEGARLLKHQWLFEHEEQGNPEHDNAANGLDSWMIGHLEELRDEGIFEFNSMPYLTYTVQALLNLQAFPKSERIRALARDLLDRMNLQYALGSLDFRRCVAFRRNTSFMDNPKRIPILSRDPHTQTMRVWAGAPAETLSDSHIALVAEIIPYTLPPVVAQWTLAKPREYYVRIGRGRLASPEIYSGGPGWLLTAGGVKRGAKSMIVARPTVLLLPDGERDYTRCFRIEGRGDYTQWNNTGVSRRFACGNSPVAGPEEALPAAESRNWAVFDPPKPERLLFALYSDKDLGFIAVFPDTDETAKALLEKLKQANPDETRLRHEFAWPSGGVIGYDVEAPAGTWTIKSVPEGIPVERKYDKWPQWDGDVPADAFARN